MTENSRVLGKIFSLVKIFPIIIHTYYLFHILNVDIIHEIMDIERTINYLLYLKELKGCVELEFARSTGIYVWIVGVACNLCLNL